MPNTFLTTLALALALRPDVLAQEKEDKAPKSPQDKIVQKYNLEEILNNAQREYNAGSGCRQPLDTKEEKEIFNDFRLMVEAAQKPDTLLLICKSVLNAPTWAIGFSSQSDPNIVRAQNPDKLPRNQRNAVLGHEIGHVVNKDQYHLVAREIAELQRNLAIIRAAVEARVKAGKPLSYFEADRINRAIQVDTSRIDRMISDNQDKEMTADLTGALLESVTQPKSLLSRIANKAFHLPNRGSKHCEIDVGAMSGGLKAILDSNSQYAAGDSFTHPSFRRRYGNLRDKRDALVDACQEHFNPKKNKPNKTPPSGRGGR